MKDDESVTREIVVKTLDFVAQEIEGLPKVDALSTAPAVLGAVMVLGMVRDLAKSTRTMNEADALEMQ